MGSGVRPKAEDLVRLRPSAGPLGWPGGGEVRRRLPVTPQAGARASDLPEMKGS